MGVGKYNSPLRTPRLAAFLMMITHLLYEFFNTPCFVVLLRTEGNLSFALLFERVYTKVASNFEWTDSPLGLRPPLSYLLGCMDCYSEVRREGQNDLEGC